MWTARARNLPAICLLMLSCLGTGPAWSEAISLERGRLLYDNHCLTCHESQVHIRHNHKVRSLEGVFRETARWAEELQLSWQASEFQDVSHYLYATFYAYNDKPGGDLMSLTLTSSAFSHDGSIPARYTCTDADISPALTWSGIPTGTRSLALIVDDPDAPDPAAPKMTWVHWVLYNLPAETQGLPEDVGTDKLPQGTLEGINDWKRTGYAGPCPPIGRHRYFFKLYALDTVLPDLKEPTKKALEKAMQGHILEQAELMGTYQK
jgi:Raf kinase inhibitor-like YbhB/YbcL family protein